MGSSATNGGHMGPESSTYLLRHKDSPVSWYTWGEEALAKAQNENKLLFITIGYAACQWSAKMLRLCFNNEKVASFLNEHFVPIAIDKDLRPDLDHYYSNAIQTLNQNSGWPITCFALPDGTPVFGATYLEEEQLLNIAEGLYNTYTTNSASVLEAAAEISKNLAFSQVQQKESDCSMSLRDIHLIVEPWKRKFDNVYGGTLHPPKFPLSGGKEFLLECAYYFKDIVIGDHLKLTLDCMAKGGIYDQINGGFFRYSSDASWRKPNFEKLLGDNAQLICLYAKAYKLAPTPLYKKVIEEAIQFCLRKLLAADSGGFYTSMSADVNGGDSLLYTWTEEEFRGLLGANADLAIHYYGLNVGGKTAVKVPYLSVELAELAKEFGITEAEATDRLAVVRQQLIKASNTRPEPETSETIIVSHNALLARALIMSYGALNYEEYAFLAQETLSFIRDSLMTDKGELYHSFQNGKPMGKGFLDDYAYTISAFIHFYLAEGEECWLYDAKRMTDYVLANFYDSKTGMFLYCESGEEFAKTQTMPVADGALPSPSSYMGHNLSALSIFFDNKDYDTKVRQMICNMKPQMAGSGPYCATWARLMLRYVIDRRVVGIVGKDAKAVAAKLPYSYRPDMTIAYTEKETSLPFFKNMSFEKGRTLAYLSVGNQPRKKITQLDELDSLLNLHRI